MSNGMTVLSIFIIHKGKFRCYKYYKADKPVVSKCWVIQGNIAQLQAYDVWQEKKLYGKVSMGVVRTTYLIGANGIIEKVWKKAKPDTNAGEILEYITGEK